MLKNFTPILLKPNHYLLQIGNWLSEIELLQHWLVLCINDAQNLSKKKREKLNDVTGNPYVMRKPTVNQPWKGPFFTLIFVQSMKEKK